MINFSIYQNPDTGFGHGYCCSHYQKSHTCTGNRKDRQP